ncbi:MAG: SpoIIE family protein phosphatase [Candidatus Kapabacteria bacterium]|nr:SpoIIE family protein phosphatase [Candidatus Kapabacteria bacterium]
MIKFKYSITPVESDFKRILLLIFSFTIITFRLITDSLIFLISDTNSSLSIIWKFFTFLALGACFFLYIFSKKVETNDEFEDSSTILFFKLIGKNIYYLLFLASISIILKFTSSDGNQPQNLFAFLIVELGSIVSLFFILNILYFIYSGFILRPHKRTKTYLKIIGSGFVYLIFTNLIFSIIKVKNSTVNDVIYIVILVILSLLVFINTKKNSWIVVLPRGKKYKVFWLSFCAIILSITIAIGSLANNGDLGKSYYVFLPGFRDLIAISLIFLSFYLLRIFFSSFTSLPTSGIVERKTSELSSLTYLNRLISEAIEIDRLIDTVTKLALGAGEANVAWTEFYDSDGRMLVKSTQFINSEQVQFIHENTPIRKYFDSISKSSIIDSIPQSAELSELSHLYGAAKSLISVPLFESDKRIGTLVVIHSDEYGFEPSDVRVLSAFGDNVGIALENNRLLNSVIEKEHYKRELILAQKIQQKLLPQDLPTLANYSLSAMTFPSEEVGGDYYDAVFLKDGRLCILIGDVSGKGITAAFYMAQLKGVVLSVANEATGAADILKRINSTLYGSMEKQMYITISSIVIDSNSGNISIARAGHMPTLIKNKGKVLMLTPNGLGIGLVSSKVFDRVIEERQEQLFKGDMCLLFTDGVNEHRNNLSEELGYEPLIKICEEPSTEDSSTLLLDLYKKVKDYADGALQHDDMTIVSLIYKGQDIGTVFE